jgi:hypothetical protein
MGDQPAHTKPTIGCLEREKAQLQRFTVSGLIGLHDISCRAGTPQMAIPGLPPLNANHKAHHKVVRLIYNFLPNFYIRTE